MIATLVQILVLSALAATLGSDSAPSCSWTKKPGTFVCLNDGKLAVYVHGKLECSTGNDVADYSVFCLPEEAINGEDCSNDNTQQTSTCLDDFKKLGQKDSQLNCSYAADSKKIVTCNNKKYIKAVIDCDLAKDNVFKLGVFCPADEFKDDAFGCAFQVTNVSETHQCEVQVAAIPETQPAVRNLGVPVPSHLRGWRPPATPGTQR
jgi:hypothetical protein